MNHTKTINSAQVSHTLASVPHNSKKNFSNRRINTFVNAAIGSAISGKLIFGQNTRIESFRNATIDAAICYSN